VTGHALKYEGAPYDDDGNRIVVGLRYWGVSGVGRAKCACGQMSEVLPSAYQRKAWYRDHKSEALGREAQS
jgi:hypothetical protein